MPPETHAPTPQGPSIFPLGIGVRLGLSFIAVIVLAATANFIARQSVAVILWRMPATPAVVVAVSPHRAAAVTPAPARAEIKPTAGLAEAADRFERACQTRAQSGASNNDSEYFAAKDALRRAIADYGLGMPPTTRTSSVAQRGASFLDRGQQFVHVADQRRVARGELTKVSQTMNDHMQSAINGAWKVFGRVIARQSLLELHADLETIRRHTDSLIAGDELDADGLAALQASENAFAQALSKSPEWTDKMKPDFDAMVKFRGALAQLNTQYVEDARRFSQAHGSFFSAVNAAALTENDAVARSAHCQHGVHAGGRLARYRQPRCAGGKPHQPCRSPGPQSHGHGHRRRTVAGDRACRHSRSSASSDP